MRAIVLRSGNVDYIARQRRGGIVATRGLLWVQTRAFYVAQHNGEVHARIPYTYRSMHCVALRCVCVDS